MEKSRTSLPLLDIMINKSGTKTGMDIYSKPADSKRYVPFMLNDQRPCLTRIPFSLARRICTLIENKNVKEKCFKKLKKNITRTKNP